MPLHHAVDLRIYSCTGLFALLALVGFSTWFRSLKRVRLIEDLGTSTARSVAQGYVEVVGTQYSVPGQLVTAPLTGTPCTWWRYSIEEKRRSWADGGRRKDWVVIEDATSSALILFKDATGQLLVHPQGAEVEPSATDRWLGLDPSPPRPMVVHKAGRGHFRYTEKRMHVGDPMYVAAELRTFSGHRQAEAYARAVSDRLEQWKRNQAKLREQFDIDRNGRIDVVEWDAVREAASAEVSSRLQASAVQQEIDVLRKPRDGQPFLLSAQPQLELVKKLRSRARAGLVLFVIGAGMLIFLIHVMRLSR
jgi:hypothetical protein